MHTVRPKNLNLFTIRFPIPAIVSILHRISGVILFLLIPVLLGLFQYSLSYVGFENLQHFFTKPIIKILLWLSLIAFFYHLVAGLRHLLGDMHIGTTLQGGRLTAKLVVIVSLLVAIMLGVWLW